MAAVRPESDDERLRAFVLKCYSATAIDHIAVAHHGAGRVLLTIYADDLNGPRQLRCDALLLDESSRTDTYPYIEVEENRKVAVAHEASVSKVGEEQLFYLMSRGLDEVEATSMIVRGFIEPIAKELPLEYALELNRLIQLEMEGSVG